MWYIILTSIIIICLTVIFLIFKQNIGKLRKINVKETVVEKQLEVKKKLLELRLEKRLIHFFEAGLIVLKNLFNKFKIPRRKLGNRLGREVKKLSLLTRTKKDKEVELDEQRKLKGDLFEAEACLKKRQIDQAEDKFIEILQSDPKSIAAYMGLGKIYVIRKEWPTAEEAYRYIVRINKKFFDGYRELINVYQLVKKWDELKKLGQEVLDLGHRQAWVYEKLGVAYRRTGYPEKAEEYFVLAVEIEPQNEKLLDQLLEAAIINKNKSLAQKAFNTLSGISRDEMKIQGYRDKIDIL